MSEDPTLPPRQPNTFRVWLPRIRDFCRAHWDWCGPLVGFAAGWILGKIL